MELREVNFAVSNICNADCIFCPRSFVTVDPSKRFMPTSLVEKVMQEVSQESFKKDHPVVHCVCSENGEPFLNPDILDILRTIRAHGLAICLFSNFSPVTEKIALALVNEHLTDTIHVNIDGASFETYKATKKLDLNVVEKNLKRFLEIRDELKSPIRIFGHIVTQATYAAAVAKEYRRFPIKLKGLLQGEDRGEVLLKWGSILKPPTDNIGIDSVLFWPERYGGSSRAGEFRCPNIERVKHCAYINPAGDWYACCFDMGNELVIGNVYETSLADLAKSTKRKYLVSMLEAGEFDKIGFPCSRVDTCNGVTT